MPRRRDADAVTHAWLPRVSRQQPASGFRGAGGARVSIRASSVPGAFPPTARKRITLRAAARRDCDSSEFGSWRIPANSPQVHYAARGGAP
jgi:hypothetical protein